MKLKRKPYSTPSNKEKLRYLRVLESNNMNKSETARQLGISRHTLTRYVGKHWDEYCDIKDTVYDDSLTVQAKKMLLSADLDKVRIDLLYSFRLAMNVLHERMDNKEDKSKFSNRDLIQYINALAPYLAEKQNLFGAKEVEEEPKQTRNTFIQNFIDQVNSYKPDQNT